MLFTRRGSAIAFVATASAAVASTTSLTPLASIGLDLALIGNTTSGILSKRSSVSGVLCGIGILSSCPSTSTVDTLTDTNNCGTLGNICPTQYANSIGTVSCSAGTCVSTCDTGFTFSTEAGGCVDTQNDPLNCGALATVCKVANGEASCSSGSCTVLSCASGFTLVNNTCTAAETVNTQTDPTNCGMAGNICTIGTGSTAVTCSTGVCQQTACSTGYTLVNGACTIINTMTSTSNCGAIGRQCPSSYANGLGTTMCVGGLCMPSACVVGYGFDTSISSCRPIMTDPNNCGAVGNVCLTIGGVSGCTAGSCVVVSCITPYRLTDGFCSMSASQRARTKRSKPVKPISLCPGTESACPIRGSKSFLALQESGFAAIRAPSKFGLQAAGGYECLDTDYSIESCGGCSSMGEGALTFQRHAMLTSLT
ncbi:hypothetical protein P7C70_g2871, partial [Phenoliferia sp. Uapishka_3]